MVWSRVLIAAGAAVALLAGDTHAQACPDGQFSVSVLDDPQVKCLASRPCSGVYGPLGLVGGVGACPSSTGCALLPHNPSVMGCVVAGRADVSYVNPDGSLTRGGVVIAGPPTVDNTANNANNVNGGYTDPKNANNNANANANNGASSNNGANANANANSANANSTVATTATPGANVNVPTPAHVKPGDVTAGSTDDASASKAPSPASSTTTPAASTSTAPASSGKPGDVNAAASKTTDTATETPTPTLAVTPTPTPTSTSASSTNQQKALDNIDGEIANNRDGKASKGGVNLGSIIAIVVGCLAVVAVIAGVFVLRKKKEQALETPAGGALDDYMGAGGVTPKENVLLL